MSSKIDHAGVRTWIEVDTEAVKHNYQLFRHLINKKCKLLAVAKSNAYGHGLVDYAKTVEQLGADWIGVDSITEAIKLQKHGLKTPLLVLGYTLPERLRETIERDISFTVSSFDTLYQIEKFKYAKKKFRVHLKIDTGMHRQGFFPDNLNGVLDYIKSNLPQIEIEGVYTHFAAAYNPDNRDYTEEQIAKFMQAVELVRSYGFNPASHAAATAGTLNYPESHFDMVRIGIGLMGLWPWNPFKNSNIQKRENTKHVSDFDTRISNFPIKPILSWRTIIAETKYLHKGSRIGYDLTETMEHETRIAILPIGYWHGYPRSLSAIGEVLVQGKRCKILGRVCMDMVMIDVTNVPNVQTGDIVTLIGRDNDEEITVYEMAEKANYSYYELITRLNPLIKKIYL